MLSHDFGIATSVVLAIAAGVSIGFLNAVGDGILGIPAFIVALAGLQVCRRLALLISGGMTVGKLPPEIKDFARGAVVGIPNLFWTMMAVAAVVHYLLRDTRTGRYMSALGSNAEASRRQGIVTFRIMVIAYVMWSGLAALAAVLLVSRLSVATPPMANAYELPATRRRWSVVPACLADAARYWAQYWARSRARSRGRFCSPRWAMARCCWTLPRSDRWWSRGF